MLKRCCDIVRYSSALAFIICLTGCLSPSPELASVRVGEKAIVLLRLESNNLNRQSGQPSRHFSACDAVFFGLGGFESGGKPDPDNKPKHWHLSKASHRDGWLYFVLPHGVHYLAIYPGPIGSNIYKRSLEDAPSWCIYLKEDVKLAYIGTLHFPAESERLLFGGGVINYIDYSRMTVEYEYGLSNELAVQFFSEFGEMHTALMKRKKGPYILSAPLPPMSK